MLAAMVALATCAPALSGCGHEEATGTGMERDDITGSADDAAMLAGIPQAGLTLGNPSAPVEMMELSDLQCPFCRNFSRDTLPTLVERYVRTGRLLLVFHNFPILGAQSTRAARLAVAVSLQNRMWGFIDVFFANQGREGSGYVTDDFLRRVAGSVPGVDVDRAMADIDAPFVTEQLDRAHGVAGAFNVRGTPSFLIGRNGAALGKLKVHSPSDPSTFTDAIDALLAVP